jgi:hypothetical protein
MRRAHRQDGRTLGGLVLLALLLLPSTVFSGDGNTPWPWPVPVDPPQITATFMESRSGGYHTGLDIGRGGAVGHAHILHRAHPRLDQRIPKVACPGKIISDTAQQHQLSPGRVSPAARA